MHSSKVLKRVVDGGGTAKWRLWRKIKVSMMSNGHVIRNTCIAVDYWTPGKFVYFLTHCHADHLVKLKHHWWLPIYTSHCNARWLEEVVKVSKHFLRPLNINEEVIIESPYSKDAFTVTLIDAQHCPGAVMFYFQGTFGNILYTGDFRYDEEMRKDLILQSIIRKQDVNVLYLDNTYASPTCIFPSREEAMEEILDIIRRHPNYHIYIGLRLLGKEEILRHIYKKLKEKVYVNEKRMRLLNTLQLQTYMCTNKQSESRISTVHFNILTSAWIEERRRDGFDCIGIKPTALFVCLNSATRNSSVGGLYVVPYSDHSSSKELSSFVSALKPEELYPIVSNTKHLGSEHNSKTLSKIPDLFYDLCRKQNADCSNYMCEEYQQCKCDRAPIFCKSVQLKYSKSRYITHKILNTGLEKKTNHSVDFEVKANNGKVHNKINHFQPHCTDLKKSVYIAKAKVVSNTILLNCKKEKPMKLGKNTVKDGFISQINGTKNTTVFTQGIISGISPNCTTESLPLNTVQRCLSNIEKNPVMYNKLTDCKASGSKVDTRLNANRTKTFKHCISSLLYLENIKETSVENKHNSDHLKQNLDFKTNKSNSEITCNTKPLKDETENLIQKQRSCKVPEHFSPDNDIIFLGTRNSSAQAKELYRESDITSTNDTAAKYTAEPLKKRIKISKKLDL